MAKLKDAPIREADLKDFLKSKSDFGFELSVLKMLRDNGLQCEHGGLYVDPVTKKPRQFDIRAITTIDGYRVRFAVECKNIRENYPVLISCVPRREDESYHQFAYVRTPDRRNVPYDPSRAFVINVPGAFSIYKPGKPVGKSANQVGRECDKRGSLVGNDGELFDKWSQSLSSLAELVEKTYWDGWGESPSSFRSCVFPVLVVPNERLWSVVYDEDGNVTSDPHLEERCSLFVGKEYKMSPDPLITASIRISHMEIMTFDGLNNFLNRYTKSVVDLSDKLFSHRDSHISVKE